MSFWSSISSEFTNGSYERMDIRQLIQNYGTLYSAELGIDLKSCSSKEIVKWFLASILFAARISEEIAKNTYMNFEKAGITTAEKILNAGGDELVAILDAGGYVRYDFKTADKLLEVFGHLQQEFGGDLNKLHEKAKDPADLEEGLKKLGKGIGDVTVAIFLGEMRRCWVKADPKPTYRVLEAMKKLGITDLKDFSCRNSIDLVQLETALVRLGRELSRKKKIGE